MAKNKYKAKKCSYTFANVKYDFDSKAEMNYFIKLADRLKRFEIEKLKLQPTFILTDHFTIATDKTKSGRSTSTGLKYTPDFEYYENGKKIVVEVKGMKTTAYQMRLKLFLIQAHAFNQVDTFIEVVKGEETRYECASVRITKRI